MGGSSSKIQSGCGNHHSPFLSKTAAPAATSKVAKYDRSSVLQAALPLPATLITIINSYAINRDSFYGPEAWKKKGVTVLDDVPEAPDGDLTDRMLVYFPQRIEFCRQKELLTLRVLKTIYSGSFSYFPSDIIEQLGNNPAPKGWFFIAKKPIPESRGKDNATQQAMVKATGCEPLSIWHAIVGNFMVLDDTGVPLFGNNPKTLVRCIEKVDGLPVTVGGYCSVGLYVDVSSEYNFNDYCAAGALRVATPQGALK